MGRGQDQPFPSTHLDISWKSALAMRSAVSLALVRPSCTYIFLQSLAHRPRRWIPSTEKLAWYMADAPPRAERDDLHLVFVQAHPQRTGFEGLRDRAPAEHPAVGQGKEDLVGSSKCPGRSATRCLITYFLQYCIIFMKFERLLAERGSRSSRRISWAKALPRPRSSSVTTRAPVK